MGPTSKYPAFIFVCLTFFWLIHFFYRWPAHTWIHIANFTAQNVRKVQLFHLEEPKWFK